ncbi:hypothetical protein E3N88_44482 [Mikania micrantha]|uniref:Uncharacterized protein n=1 Tax=Mikania micrantha TaxID=192012 RepID=A0A5N6LBV8_9ASTR|nr:hypothetical protein E3N88_44482 [Mikania micrantha]
MPKPPNALLSTRVQPAAWGRGVPDPVSACHAMGRPCAARPRMVTRPGRMARPWGRPPLLLVGKQATGTRVASSPDSDLEAFSHNPAHGSFAPLAFQPSAMTNCANQRFLSY